MTPLVRFAHWDALTRASLLNVMHMIIDLDFHPSHTKLQYASMILFVGTMTTLWAAKFSHTLSFVIGSYWSFLLLRKIGNKVVKISEAQVVISSLIFRFTLTKKIFPMSNFCGVRNRVHWGHYKHCQTELIGKNGIFLPIRVELMTGKITLEASKLKENLVKEFGLESCPDFEHA